MHTHVYIRDAVVQLEHGSYYFIQSGLRRKISSQSMSDIGNEFEYRYLVRTAESHLDRKAVRAHVVGLFYQTRRELIPLSGEINSRHALCLVCVDHDYHSIVVLGQDR
jgi:hypothetical protein